MTPRWRQRVWLALMLVCGSVLLRTPLDFDLSGFLPRAASPAQRLLVSQLHDGIGGRLILAAISGDDAAARAGLSQRFAARLQASGAFSLVANGAPPPPAQLEWLIARRYALSPITRDSFSTAALKRALEDDLRLLASPAAALVKPLLPRDPTGESWRLLQTLGGDRATARQDGVWATADGKQALLLAYSRAPGFDAAAQQRTLAAMHAAFEAAKPAASRAALHLSGPAVFSVEARRAIEAASHRTSLAALLLVALILAAVYRAWRPVALSLIPVLTGLTAGAAAVAAGFGEIHGITLAFGAVLIGEAVDYPAYLYTYRRADETLERTARRIQPTLALAMLTTAIGALAMLLAGFDGLRQLGVLVAVGALAAGLATRWLLPTLDPGHYRLPALPAWRLPGRLPRWLPWALLAGAMFVLARSDAIWDDDPARLSPLSAHALAQDRALRQQLGAPDVRYLLAFSASTADAALALSEAQQARLDALVAQRVIGSYQLAAQTLPSLATQAARRAAIPDRASLARNLQLALQGLPYRPDTFAPFLHALDAARRQPPLTRHSLDGTVWGTRVDALLSQHDGRWTALAPLAGVAKPEALRAAFAAQPGVTLIDLKGDAENLLRHAREQALWLIGAGIVIIALLLAAALQSPRAAARALAPVLAALVMAVAALVLIGERLNLFHLISLLLVLGIGLNYALFFQRRDTHASHAQLAVALCGSTSLAAFACLALSSIPVLHAVGLSVVLGTLFSLFNLAAWRHANAVT
jgi:predicted exporter